MGWTSENRPNGFSTRDWFAQKFDAHYEIKASAVVGDAFYAAVHDSRDDRTFAFVALVKRGSGYFNFTYKDMDESMGPNAAEAPARVLDALSPTEHEWALEWRAACRKNIERATAAKKVTSGTRIDLGRTQEFQDGGKGQVFTLVERNTFLRADGRRVRIPNWRKNYAWSVAS